MDSDLESDSEDESVEMDDLEEGEIQEVLGQDDGLQDGVQFPTTDDEQAVPASVENEPVPEVVVNVQTGDPVIPPVELEGSPVVHGSQANEESPGSNVNMGNINVHGKGNLSAHGNGYNDVSVDMGGCPILEVNTVGPDMVNNNSEVGGFCGPNGQGMKPNTVNGDDGPTPYINLGKRYREDRSPPSIGSTQGPSQKLFGQSVRLDSVSLDLNSPAREPSGCEESARGNVGADGVDSVNREDVTSGDRS
ncbi:hypothetical protein Hanom_Chr03g00199631 [Helianthus anomalus]